MMLFRKILYAEQNTNYESRLINCFFCPNKTNKRMSYFSKIKAMFTVSIIDLCVSSGCS